jgi:hypothetical protein
MSQTTLKCALRSSSPCEGPISGEHYISKSVLKVIAPSDRVLIEGAPWAPIQKTVGHEALTANVLCKHHNSTLAGLDSEAGRLATFLRDAQLSLAEPTSESRSIKISGRLLERWLLKVVFGMWASGNVAVSNVKIATSPNADLGPLLLGLKPMPPKWGLYVRPPNGPFAASHQEFEVEFRIAPGQVVKGAEFKICRMPLTLVLGVPGGDWGVRRPANITLRNTSTEYKVRLDWGLGTAGMPIVYTRIADAPSGASDRHVG